MRDGNKHVLTAEIIDIAMRQGKGFEASALFSSIVSGIGNATATIFKNNGNDLLILYSRRISYDGAGGGAPNQTIYSPQFIKPGKSLLLEIEGRSGTQAVSSKLEWVEVNRIPSIVSEDGYLTAEYTGVTLDE